MIKPKQLVKINDEVYLVDKFISYIQDHNVKIIVIDDGRSQKFITGREVESLQDIDEELKPVPIQTVVDAVIPDQNDPMNSKHVEYYQFKAAELTARNTSFMLLESLDTGEPIAPLKDNRVAGYWDRANVQVTYNQDTKKYIAKFNLYGVLFVNRLDEQYRTSESFNENILCDCRLAKHNVNGKELDVIHFDLIPKDCMPIEENSVGDKKALIVM